MYLYYLLFNSSCVSAHFDNHPARAYGMLGNRPSTIEDDLYPTALVQFGSALSSVAAASAALPDLSNDSTSFEPNKGMCTILLCCTR